MLKILTFVLVALTASTAFAGGGNYFSGPGRSPSYGPAAIAAGFGSGASTHSSQQTASNTPTSPNNCGCQNSGHH